MSRIELLAMCVLLVVGASAGMAEEEGIIDRVEKACQPEIEKYCSQVTPGEGRMLACFYAHGDKLSSRCDYALYQGAVELEQFIEAMVHVATECNDDLMKFCADVEMGEGRVATCLLDHKSEVTEACARAIEDTKLEVDVD